MYFFISFCFYIYPLNSQEYIEQAIISTCFRRCRDIAFTLKFFILATFSSIGACQLLILRLSSLFCGKSGVIFICCCLVFFLVIESLRNDEVVKEAACHDRAVFQTERNKHKFASIVLLLSAFPFDQG